MYIPKVSVIVPVYNTAKFLHKCLDSLSSQTMKELEFILVDDGSTDGSGLICDTYALKDERFKVIHQKNGGSSIARQVGMDQSLGEFLIICDSDDWVEPNMYENLYNRAKETDADIVSCNYYSEYPDGKSTPIQYKFKENEQGVDNFDFIKNAAGSSWTKLVSRSLFKRTNSYYEKGINLSEDLLIFYKLMKGNPKVIQIKDNLYHYRRQFGGNSYTNSLSMIHIMQLQFTYKWLKENYTENKYEPIIRQRAIDLGFAFLRAKDTDKILMKNFLNNQILWKDFSKDSLSVKKLLVYSQKLLPLRVSKMILKTLYPFFYK